ncbi:hypothetical protein ACHAW6_001965, partial [Cyclotella cf. meneghiniana]
MGRELRLITKIVPLKTQLQVPLHLLGHRKSLGPVLAEETQMLPTQKFHYVQELIDAFDNHYSNEYLPSWTNCLNESMNTWLNKYAQSFMCVPRKPHPFRDDYHSIADSDDGKSI